MKRKQNMTNHGKMPAKPSQQSSPALVVRLSTGYQAPLDLRNLPASLEHLSRALLGEVLVPKLRRTAKARACRQAVKAVHREIFTFVSSLDEAETKALLHAVLWHGVMSEISRLEARNFEAN